MPNNPALQALQGVTFNMADPRNKMPRRLTPERGQALMGTPMESLGAYEGGLDLQDELSQNLANTPSSDAYAVERLKGLMGNNQKDLSSSYIPQQMAQTNQWHQNDAAARTEGFGSMGTGPTSSGQSAAQSREIYKRNQAEEKMRQPLDIIKAEQQGGLDRARITSDAMVRQAQIPADVKREGYGLLSKAMGIDGDNGLGQGQSLSISGVGSTRQGAVSSPPNAAFENIQKARIEYEAAKQGDKWYTPGDNQTGFRKKALDDAIQGYLGQYKATNPLAKSKASALYNDPEFLSEDISTEDIIGLLMESDPDFEQLGEDGLIELEEMLRTMRGGR